MRHSQYQRTIALSLILLIVYFLEMPTGIHGQAPSEVISVRWSPDGSKIAITGINGLFKIWDTTNQRAYEITNLTGLIMAAAWSPDGTRIATAAEDGLVKIWNATNAQLVTT